MTPIVQVFLNGEDISSKFAGRILKGSIVEHDGGKADELTLTLSNHDGLLAKPKSGAILDIALGFKINDVPSVAKVGSFNIQEVVKVGVGAQFEITGQAADFKKTLKGQKSRSWIKKTLGDVVKQIASDNGLQPAISAKLAAIKGNFYQTGVSDIHLITDLARKYGAVGKVASGRLVFTEKGSGESASGAAMTPVVITPNDLEDDFRISEKDRPNRGKVKAKHYDRDKATRKEVVEGDGDGPEYVFPQIFGSEEDAKKAVSARKREFDQDGKTFTGTLMSGRNDAKAGGVAESKGFGDDDDHQWTFNRVTHDFSDTGYITKFEAKTKDKKEDKAAAKKK